MSNRFIKTRLFQRLLEIIVPISSWFLITLPLWLSPFHPAIVAYFIIAFDLYFFSKCLSTAYSSVVSYNEILFHSQIRYYKKLKNLKNFNVLKHFIIIPNYKEPIYKLNETIKTLIDNDYPDKDNIYLVLAFEKREFESTQKNQIIINQYQKYFKKIIITDEEKFKALKRIIDTEKTKNEEIFFLEDRTDYIAGIKNEIPWVKTILMRRPQGRYKDEVLACCDFRIKNLKEAEKIINKCLRKGR